MEIREKIKGILQKYHYTDLPTDEAIDQILRLFSVVGRSEQLVCDCGNSSMTWYGNDDDKKWFCFNCKKEAN